MQAPNLHSEGISKPILMHAKRLLNDAELLRKHGRFSSALGLAVLSLEEIGKLAIKIWQADEDLSGATDFDRNYHLTKQAAGACLLLAWVASERLLKSRKAGLNEDAVVDDLARTIANCREEQLAMVIDHKALDWMKQATFYWDDNPVYEHLRGSGFNNESARVMIEDCRTAIRMIDDRYAMSIARLLFVMRRERRNEIHRNKRYTLAAARKILMAKN